MTRIGNRKVQFIILLTLVCLVGTMSIAYAILSTTLNINGTAQVQDASWNVHFDNIQVNPYSVDINPVITDNNKVSFSADLTTPGDFYKFTVDILNEGSIDAMIESIIKTPDLTDEEKKYLRYEVEYVDGTSINDSQLLKSEETKTISILFSYRNDIPTSDLPTTESEFDLEIVLVYVQADSSGTEISGTDSKVKVVSGDLNTVGSEICIGEECFYLMKNDGHTVTMLAKYNLYVGGKFESNNWTAYGAEATGIQNSMMLGYLSDDEPRRGTVGFATTGNNYWTDTVNNSSAYVYNENSYLYKYVENYKCYLSEFDVSITSARLVKFEELEQLGCSLNTTDCSSSEFSWIYSTTYWTGTAYGEKHLRTIFSNGKIVGGIYDNFVSIGVRPVIEIPLSEF